MNLLDNPNFIFNCPHTFSERFSGAEDFFKPKDDIEPDPVRGLGDAAHQSHSRHRQLRTAAR